MNSFWNIRKIGKQFGISIRQRMTSGPLLRVAGHRQIVEAVSDRPRLSRYSEIEIAGIRGAPATYLLTRSLIDYPQLFIGYQDSGFPLLLGVLTGTEGHVTILGPTGSGKTTTMGSLIYQTLRHGYPAVVVGPKSFDPILYASSKAGAESLTRLDSTGKPVASPFRIMTLQPGVRTSGFNYMDQQDPNLPKWVHAGNMLNALGQGATVERPEQRYFTTAGQQFLQGLNTWGDSFQELNRIAAKEKQDRDARYATSGIRHEIQQQAAIEQANLPKSHPANIDLGWIIENRGAYYCDGCFMDVGAVATATCGLAAQASIFAKRRKNPGRDALMFLFIDEAQKLPRELLQQIVEQARGSGIRLVLAYHNLDQFGDDWETISMTQVRMIFGAVPGGSTDRHLQALFGTKKEYPIAFGNTQTDTEGWSSSVGTTGSTVTNSWSKAIGKQVGFSEREANVWTPNHTLALNYDRNKFVFQSSPATELADFGPRPALCQREGQHLPFAEIDRISREVARESDHTMLPGQKRNEAQEGSPLSPALQQRRQAMSQLMRQAAAQVREIY